MADNTLTIVNTFLSNQTPPVNGMVEPFLKNFRKKFKRGTLGKTVT